MHPFRILSKALQGNGIDTLLVQVFGAEDDECVRFMSERERHAFVWERDTHVYERVCPKEEDAEDKYGVPTISSLLKIIGLFCKRAL